MVKKGNESKVVLLFEIDFFVILPTQNIAGPLAQLVRAPDS